MAVMSELLPEIVGITVAEAGIIDVHTHLCPASFGHLLLRGIDELLTYHYLIAETLRWVWPVTVWVQALFLNTLTQACWISSSISGNTAKRLLREYW